MLDQEDHNLMLHLFLSKSPFSISALRQKKCQKYIEAISIQPKYDGYEIYYCLKAYEEGPLLM